MKKVQKIISWFFIIFTLAGCKNYPISSKHSELVTNKEKGIILFSSNVGLDWMRVDKNGEIIKNSSILVSDAYSKGPDAFSNELSNRSIDAYIVPPGEYTLEAVSYRRSDKTITTISLEDVMGFTIKGGEIIYLGDIIFDFTDNKVQSKVIDRLDEDLKHFKDILPTLYTIIQKRLIHTK